jgi:hypothetical protein
MLRQFANCPPNREMDGIKERFAQICDFVGWLTSAPQRGRSDYGMPAR